MPLLNQVSFATPPTLGIAAALVAAYSLYEARDEFGEEEVVYAMIVGGAIFAATAYGPEVLG